MNRPAKQPLVTRLPFNPDAVEISNPHIFGRWPRPHAFGTEPANGLRHPVSVAIAGEKA